MNVITYDNSTAGNESVTNSLSFSFTVGNFTNMVALASIAQIHSTSLTQQTPTFAVGSSSTSGAVTAVQTSGSPATLQFTYALFGLPTGAQTVTFGNLPATATTFFYTLHTYYYTPTLDKSNDTSGVGTSLSVALTPSVNNCLVWGAGALWCSSPNGSSLAGAIGDNNNVLSGIANTSFIGAGDAGVISPASSQNATASATTGNFQSCLALISILPLTPAQGGFLLNMV